MNIFNETKKKQHYDINKIQKKRKPTNQELRRSVKMVFRENKTKN